MNIQGWIETKTETLDGAKCGTDGDVMNRSKMISEIHRLERELYRGRTFHQGDYDFDHAGLTNWEPDWTSFDSAAQELGGLRRIDDCPDEVRTLIDRLIESARKAQGEASQKVVQGEVVISSQPLTSNTYDEVLPYVSML